MDVFNGLVGEQMRIMEKLLYLQGELERCEEIETQLLILQKETELKEVQIEISNMKEELKKIQKIFELQTEKVIKVYQENELKLSSSS
ncbi:YgaB family protein [Niallia sp. FSL R7-0648]|uniref:YgaB family protein n=1 Tax=Niallia sp. FSL R7-0648 TaxID=2954521 RepID=UPI0030F70341